MNIILASSSIYRRRLLERLCLEFRCIPPDVDETPIQGESPAELSVRLARLKARSVAQRYPQALVIGSDQVAAIEGRILCKPGNLKNATEQLKLASGREVHFFTAIAVSCAQRQEEQFHVEPFTARFRSLSDQQIANYLHLDEPFDCAGSFKVERLGIALFDALIGNDPTSIEGLPLIKLTELLLRAGVDILGRK